MQMIGRGLRVFPGKRDCLVFDFCGLRTKFGFVTEPVQYDIVQGVLGDETYEEKMPKERKEKIDMLDDKKVELK